jgi:hypothetical protein
MYVPTYAGISLSRRPRRAIKVDKNFRWKKMARTFFGKKTFFPSFRNLYLPAASCLTENVYFLTDF